MISGDKTGSTGTPGDDNEDGAFAAPPTPRRAASDRELSPDPAKLGFGQKLRRLMLDRGWHQSELARRADIPRDSISVYIRGRATPSALNIQKLAAALGIKAEELFPTGVGGTSDRTAPTLEIKATSSDEAWVRVNRVVSMSTAVKLAELLNNDTSDRD